MLKTKRTCLVRWGVGMLLVCLVIATLGTGPLTVTAQAEDTIRVQPPNTEAFPLVEIVFKLPALSNPLTNSLQADQLQVIENGTPIPVSNLEEERKGVHFTLAINGGYDLAVRDENGVSVYDVLTEALINWAESRQFAPHDSWSLITHEGAIVRNQAAPEPWINALASYQPNFRTMTPDFSSVETAFQLARERVVPFGVDKALLVITLPPEPGQIALLNALAAEAQTANIQVNIWMVGDAYFLTNEQGQSLVNLAESSGGAFTHLNAMDPVPDPEAYLAPFGTVYHLSYLSSIRQTGDFRLRIEADFGSETFGGESGLFHVEVSPPKPILISPPAVITRQMRPETAGSLGTFSHGQQTINFIIEFPDGRPRDISASRLFVNEILADERSDAPFDELLWDLSAITESGKYVIQVEVEDSFGLAARTNPVPVQVSVLLPEPVNRLSSQEIGMIFAAVLLLGALILFLIWILRRWWRSATFEQARSFLIRVFSSSEAQKVPEPAAETRILAYLIPAGVIDSGWRAAGHAISQSEAIIGSDPERASLVIQGRDLEGVQAQILFQEGVYTIKALGGDSATWVNYARVDRTPVRINTGDLIHFGNTAFRFTIMEDQSSEKLIAEPYEPIL